MTLKSAPRGGRWQWWMQWGWRCMAHRDAWLYTHPLLILKEPYEWGRVSSAPWYSWGKWRSARLSHLPKVTQVGSGTWTQVVHLLSQHALLTLCYWCSHKDKEASNTRGMSRKIRSSIPVIGTICKESGMVGRKQIVMGWGGIGYEEVENFTEDLFH